MPPQPPIHNLAANLAHLRARRGMSQRELARAAGITQITVNNIENEHANPRVSTLMKLAAALGVSVARLLAPAQKENQP